MYFTGKANTDRDHSDYIPTISSFNFTPNTSTCQHKLRRFERVQLSLRRKLAESFQQADKELVPEQAGLNETTPTSSKHAKPNEEPSILYEATPIYDKPINHNMPDLRQREGT